MSTTVNVGWLNDKNGNKFAPKTLSSQVITSDGIALDNKIESDLAALENKALEAANAYTDEQISNHNHDDVYYTQTQIDTMLGEKADSVHTHNDIYYTESEIDEKIDTINDSISDSMAEAKSYADAGDTTTLSSAKTYADNAVAQKSQVQIIIWEADD